MIYRIVQEFAPAMVSVLIGLGTWWLVETGLFYLAWAGLFPLPVLVRWKRAVPLFRRSKFVLPFFLTMLATTWLVESLGRIPLVPACIATPLALSLKDGQQLVILGIALGLHMRGFKDLSNPYDGSQPVRDWPDQGVESCPKSSRPSA